MEILEAYIKQKLKENERIAFEQELATNRELRRKVVTLKLIQEIIRHHTTQKKIASIHEAMTLNWNPENHSTLEDSVQKLNGNLATTEEKVEEVIEVEEEVSEKLTRRVNWLSNLLLGLGGILFITFGIFVFLVYKPIDLPKFEKNYPFLLEAQNAYQHHAPQKAMNKIEEGMKTNSIESNDETKFIWFKTIVLSELGAERTQKSLKELQKQPDANKTFSWLENLQIWCRIGWLKLMGKSE